MIVDCHAHIFTHWIGACGHSTREVHKRYLQRVVTRTAAPTFRLRDGKRADTKALFRVGEEGWSVLADVDFRVGRFGQLEFTHEGEDYGIQYMPVGMQEQVAPPELMLASGPLCTLHATLAAGTARKVASSSACQAASWSVVPSSTLFVTAVRVRPVTS